MSAEPKDAVRVKPLQLPAIKGRTRRGRERQRDARRGPRSPHAASRRAEIRMTADSWRELPA